MNKSNRKYGETKRLIRETVTAKPGQTTADIIKSVGATDESGQKLARIHLTNLYRSKALIRTEVSLQRGRTFAYFANTPAGRMARATMDKTQPLTINRIVTAIKAKRDMTAKEIGAALGLTAQGDMNNLRGRLKALTDAGYLIRSRKLEGYGFGKGAPEYTYRVGAKGTRPTPAETVDTGTTTTQPLTNQDPLGARCNIVEAVVRVHLEDGPHEMTLRHAQRLKEELTTLLP